MNHDEFMLIVIAAIGGWVLTICLIAFVFKLFFKVDKFYEQNNRIIELLEILVNEENSVQIDE